jgi:hypothetical protein
MTGDFTIEEKIKRLKEKLNSKVIEPIPDNSYQEEMQPAVNDVPLVDKNE